MLNELSTMLKRIGFPPNLHGYDYSRYAIMLAVKNPELTKHVTKALYPEIANHFKVSSKNVERCIRKAIESAWLRGDNEFNYDLFQYSISASKGKPTNAEFISVVSEYFILKYQMDSLQQK